MYILGCREPHGDLEASGTMGVGPVHALPSTCLQKVEEQPEDADNQRNVTRMGSQPSDLSATVHIPVTLTGPPGDTAAVPSEYLPVSAGQAPFAVPPPHDNSLGTEHAGMNHSTSCRGSPLWCICALMISLCFPVAQRSTVTITCHYSLFSSLPRIFANYQLSGIN